MLLRVIAAAFCALSCTAASSEINPGNAGRLHLKWKLHLPGAPRELTNLATPRATESFVIIAGASSALYVVDASSGKLLRRLQLSESASPEHSPSWLCPNALNAAPAVEVRGSTTIAYLLAADGRLHAVSVPGGEETQPPIQFVPPFSKAWALTLDKGVLYTATSQGCSGSPNGVYSLDFNQPAHPVHFFAAAASGAGIWGSAGITLANGLVFAATGDGLFDPDRKSFANSVIALRAPALEFQDYFAPANWQTLDRRDLDMGSISPVVFPLDGKTLIVAAGKEGRIFLLDAKALGGPRHQEPLFESPVLVNLEQSSAGRGFWGAFATWESPQAVRYLFAPAWGPVRGGAAHGAILAFRVEDHAGAPTLNPAWTSPDLNVPAPPVAANGVLFAVSSGEQSAQTDKTGRPYTTLDRIHTAPGHAILYALDAATGRVLFSSGNDMRGFTHMNGFTVFGGEVYVATFDSMLYCFGL